MAPVLEFRSVSKSFPGHVAVDGVSLTVPEGAFFSLLGPSGCGKTTMLRLVAGFEQPEHGDILLRGESINGLRPYQRGVSTVFQNYALFPHLNAAANIEFGLWHQKGISAATRARKVSAAVDLVQLASKEHRMPHELSGGERQRVALARSLVVEPQVLLLDEPLSALDQKLRRQMRVELKSLQRRLGTAFLFVTHDQEEALSLSDRLAVMIHGRMEQVGTPEEVYLRPLTRYVAGFLGSVNWINGVGLRPESTRLSFDRPNGDMPSVAAVVESCAFLGNCLQVGARLAGGETVVAEVPRDGTRYESGAAVHVYWHNQDELHLPGA